MFHDQVTLQTQKGVDGYTDFREKSGGAWASEKCWCLLLCLFRIPPHAASALTQFLISSSHPLCLSFLLASG